MSLSDYVEIALAFYESLTGLRPGIRTVDY